MNVARTLAPSAPEKGSFPLDHFGECSAAMQVEMNGSKSPPLPAFLCLPPSLVQLLHGRFETRRLFLASTRVSKLL